MTKVEISFKSITYAIGLILLLIVAWKIQGVLFALFIAYILMSGSAPLVDWLSKNGVNKALAIGLTYLLAIGFLAVLLFIALPPLIEETRDFILKMPTYVNEIVATFNRGSVPGITPENLTDIVSRRLDTALSNLLQVVLNVFSLFVTFITVAVFTFYLLLERDRVKKKFSLLFPHSVRERVQNLSHKIEVKLGAWVRGLVVLMFAVGLATFIGLSILGVEFALPLAVIAGLLEIIPVMGPIVAAIPAVIIAFSENPILGIATIALYILIQQLENNILVPKIMEKAIGLSPLITIFALLVGGTLFGIIGALLSVPAAAIGSLIFEDFVENTKTS